MISGNDFHSDYERTGHYSQQKRKNVQELGNFEIELSDGKTVTGFELLANGPDNLSRREKCEKDLALYLKTYHTETFYSEFAPFHHRACDTIQASIETGGKYVYAMQRGGGKTAIAVGGAEWSTSYGISEFTILISATQELADEQIETIKSDWMNNELLLLDFPEIAVPFRHLEDEARKAKGQSFRGKKTRVRWDQSKIIYPLIDVPYSQGGEAVIVSVGIKGAIRGRRYKKANGETVRPRLAIVDDPQTAGSATSESQCRERLRILRNDVCGLGGRLRSCSVVVPGTVIADNDMVHQLLNDEDSDWYREKSRMLETFPENLKIWEDYWAIYKQCQKTKQYEPAHEFYRANRDEMDRGAKVNWVEGYDREKAISAIEMAMILFMGDADAFWAECQNEPRKNVTESDICVSDKIGEKMNGVKRGLVPHASQHLVAQIDVQGNSLWWVVAAFSEGFKGDGVDYGIFPEQPTRYATLSGLKNTLKKKCPGMGDEASLLHGLLDLFEYLATRQFAGETGEVHRLAKIGVDEGYKTSIVHTAIRTSNYANIIVPTKGMGIKAKSYPLNHESKDTKPGEIIGDYWRLVPNNHGHKSLQVDTNEWKSFFTNRLATPRGDTGAFCLPQEPVGHNECLADHLKSEKAVLMHDATHDRWKQEWEMKTIGKDNHWWDGFVGCCVLASTLGVKLGGIPQVKKKGRKVIRRAIYD